jgi:hypothetical protein
LLNRLEWKHNIADFLSFTILDEFYLALVIEQQKPIFVGKGLSRFNKANNLLLFLFSQSRHAAPKIGKFIIAPLVGELCHLLNHYRTGNLTRTRFVRTHR